MSDVSLVIGSKRRSSWSLRPWLFLHHHGVGFREVVIELDQPQTRPNILKYSPSGRVPVLLSSEFAVWESMAICEFAAEWFALPGAWPMAPGARALARAAAHEMHAGFADLRRELPFDAARRPMPAAMSERAQADIERIRTLWRGARTRFGADKGPWLFGHFGIVDAMFAPVALRLYQYAVPIDGPERAYYEAVIEHHAVEAWVESVEYEMGRSSLKPQAPTASRVRGGGEALSPNRSGEAAGITSVIVPE
ncbi:MAG: glutathione S-transferase family protein [Panacagrimonas sp.]